MRSNRRAGAAAVRLGASVLIVAVLAGGCASGGPVAGGGTDHPSPIVVSPTSAGDLGGSPSPSDDLGTPVDIDSGRVGLILVGPTALASGSVIRASVTNGLDRTIYTQDEKSGCSIVFLERRTGDRWQPVGNCPVRRLAFVVAVGAGRGRIVEIDPNGLGLSGEVSAGTYRLRFTYGFDDGREVQETEVSVSPTFDIR